MQGTTWRRDRIFPREIVVSIGEIHDGDTVVLGFGLGYYTKVDFGIANYHFEVALGKMIL